MAVLALNSTADLVKAIVLFAAVVVHAPLLMGLSSRRRRSNHPVLHFFLWGVSTAYFPLMSGVISFLTCYLPSVDRQHINKKYYWFLFLVVMVVLIQFVRANADKAALAVAAVTSPVSGTDTSLKIRPSMESLVYSIFVAGLVIYNIYSYEAHTSNDPDLIKVFFIPLIGPLWALGACRMVLRFAAFQKATGSFALGRNVQLISGYMATLQQEEGQVPRLIVTGERNQDVEETPTGYHIKPSTSSNSLITLDRIWLECDSVLGSELRDLCLSFALFKCLRRRLAGCRLAEAGTSWAFHFVRDGLLGQEDDHERIFRVIAGELSFARDFYYSPLPVASLGPFTAVLHFLLFLLISAWFFFLTLLLLVAAVLRYHVVFLAFVLSVVIVSTEISDMVDSVRSNWTKISIISHYIRFRHNSCIQRIFSCLLRCKARKYRMNKIGQMELLKPSNFCKPVIEVPPELKADILTSFRNCGGQLSDGTATLQRHHITWACHCDGEVTTTTDLLLVWHIATSLFEIRCSSHQMVASPCSTPTTSMVVAQSLSRYCAYLVMEAPDLLPDNSAWTKRRYKAVKKGITEVCKSSGAVPESGVYGHLIASFSVESSHEVLKKGSRLGKQLVEEAQRRSSGVSGTGARGQDAVWQLLAEFWSEMVLYLAPSDNVKHHIEALQYGGELITLLWALLLHAGITSRPARHVLEP